MTMPRVLKVGPFKVDVSTKPLLNSEFDATTMGLYTRKHNHIYINSDTDEITQKETVIHELFHAIWQHTGLHHTVSAAKEERIISALAPQILDVLRRNPTLSPYLIEDV